jgi:hypothetical protein
LANTFTVTPDYIEDGYPHKEFVQIFPENCGSTADGNWQELLGYSTGRIGFIMLLDHEGTLVYLENNNIWPETWWILSKDWYHMYLGNGKDGEHQHWERGTKLSSNALTYACPLGFIEIWISGQKVRALVDTGAKMNIMPETLAIQLKLPSREIIMNIVGIGGHSTPIVGLAEGVHLCIDEEDEKAANFFIARGKVYTVLGRPFLADHKVRLELSKSRGEILSYELWDGGRLCIPIVELPGGIR